MKEKIILVGGGGHCKSCIDVIEQQGTYEIVGIVDLPEKLHEKILGYEIIGTDEDLPRLAKEFLFFLITLGQIRTAAKRVQLFNSLQEMGSQFPTIVSPLAYVSPHAQIGAGTVVMHHALVNAGARIGANCIINTKALVEHDAVIEDHCHIATAAVINGGVKVGVGTFFGSNALSREYIKIGNNCVIGGGVSLLQNVSPKSLLKR